MSTNFEGADAPAPSFAELGVPQRLIACLDKQGINQPLAIQAATIPDSLSGHDISAKAPTGSGKTLAFALPLAAAVERGRPKRPRALVLAPTRELSSQIAEVLRPLLKARGLWVHSFYGGVGFGPQRNALRKGVDVVVGCPGRLEDLIRQGDLCLADVDLVVVDEADRMADMGFLPAVSRLLEATATDRQTLLFSATLDGDVDVLVRRFQRRPVRHEVAGADEEKGQVTHRFETVAYEDRVSVCAEIVGGDGTSVVFARTRHGVDRLTKQLERTGVAAGPIHGGRSQAQRERTLAAFKAGRVRVLVATDVAARGIHVDDVSRVVHYDLPADAKDYVHRSGRTGRAGAEGTVVSLITPNQRGAAAALRRTLDLDVTGDVGGPMKPSDRPTTGSNRPSNKAPNGQQRQSRSRGSRRSEPFRGAKSRRTGTAARRAAPSRARSRSAS